MVAFVLVGSILHGAMRHISLIKFQADITPPKMDYFKLSDRTWLPVNSKVDVMYDPYDPTSHTSNGRAAIIFVMSIALAMCLVFLGAALVVIILPFVQPPNLSPLFHLGIRLSVDLILKMKRAL